MDTTDKPGRRGSGSVPRAENKTVYMKARDVAELRKREQEPLVQEEVRQLLGAVDVRETAPASSQEEEVAGLDNDFFDTFDALPEELASESEDALATEELQVGDAALDVMDEAFGVFDFLEQEQIPLAGDIPQESVVDEIESAPQMSAPVAKILRTSAVVQPEDVEMRESEKIEHQIEGFREARESRPSEEQTVRYSDIAAQEPPLRGVDNSLAGFLVSFDEDPRGSFAELREGRLVITSEPFPMGASLVIDHPSVSPMHAILRIERGRPIQILDQLSEFGTRIIRARDGKEERLSGERGALHHGDVVLFGDRKYHVCLVSLEAGSNA